MEERKSKRSPENHDAETLWKQMFSRPKQVLSDMQKKYMQGKQEGSLCGICTLPPISPI
jgi:hypothetical protein